MNVALASHLISLVTTACLVQISEASGNLIFVPIELIFGFFKEH